MASDCNYNCVELPEHERIDCGIYPVGGISAMAVLDCDHGITDWTDPTEWETAIASNKATIIKGIKGELPDPSPVTMDNPADADDDTYLAGFDRTATFQNGDVTPGNIDMVNRLNRWKGGLVLYERNENRITVIDAVGSYTVMRNIPNNKKAVQLIKGTYKWSNFNEPPIYDAPAGIFD